MPLPKGGGQRRVGPNIRELHQGKTYARTQAKFGKAKADAQAIAIAEKAAGNSRPRQKKKAR